MCEDDADDGCNNRYDNTPPSEREEADVLVLLSFVSFPSNNT